METFSALLAFCVGNSPVTGEFPAQRPVTRALMFSLIWACTNSWANNGDAGDLRRHDAHYDVIVICTWNYRLQNVGLVLICMDIYKFVRRSLTCLWPSFLYNSVTGVTLYIPTTCNWLTWWIIKATTHVSLTLKGVDLAWPFIGTLGQILYSKK